MLEKELHYFLALAQTRNFTRAAEKMYVTQPAFSRKIAELEEETGCQLIVRKTRPIELTPAGEIFLKWATVLAGDLEQMEEAMARARQGITGQVRIGYNGSTHMPYVDAGLKALEEHAPQIECIVKRGEPPKLEQLLQEGELDGIFSNLPHVSRFDWMDYITVEPCGVTALLNAKHPLSGAQGLYLSQIAGEPYVDYERKMSPNAHDFIWEAFRRAGFTPNVAVCVQDVEEIAVMVAADRGFALMSGSAAQSLRSDKLCPVPVLDCPAGYDLVFAWHRERMNQNLICFRNAIALLSQDAI